MPQPSTPRCGDCRSIVSDSRRRSSQNGRLAYDLGVYRVKSPAESKRPWDYYERIATVPAATAFRQAANSGCGLAASIR